MSNSRRPRYTATVCAALVVAAFGAGALRFLPAAHAGRIGQAASPASGTTVFFAVPTAGIVGGPTGHDEVALARRGAGRVFLCDTFFDLNLPSATLRSGVAIDRDAGPDRRPSHGTEVYLQDDNVVHVYRPSTGAVTNLGLAFDGRGLAAGEDLVVFGVSEAFEAGVDLNGDGDIRDSILHLHQPLTGATTNLGLAGFEQAVTDRVVVFSVSERAQGDTDLNGDGDTHDLVLHVYHRATGLVANLGLAASGVVARDGLVVFLVSEIQQGEMDLNGDGDVHHADLILHLYDSSTGVTANTEIAGVRRSFERSVAGDLVALTVRESAQGNQDLNGDGDAEDVVLHLYRPSTDTLTNQGVAANNLVLSGDVLVFQVRESDQGVDLNEDGDVGGSDFPHDNVLHVHRLSTGATVNLRVAADAVRVAPDLIAFVVSERLQGETDLNGDGQVAGRILHVHRPSTGEITNLEFVIPGVSGEPEAGEDVVAFTRSESLVGTDLNGDGDTEDRVAHVYRPSTGTVTNLGLVPTRLSATGFGVVGDVVILPVLESSQGRDLNGDGDTDDLVFHTHRSRAGVTTNFGLASFRLFVRAAADLLGVFVPEAEQGGTDLNGDGDADDHVLHVHELSAGVTTNLGLATPWPVAVADDLVAFGVSETLQAGTELNGDGDAGGPGPGTKLGDLQFRGSCLSFVRFVDFDMWQATVQ